MFVNNPYLNHLLKFPGLLAMVVKTDLYDVLGVEPDAEEPETSVTDDESLASSID